MRISRYIVFVHKATGFVDKHYISGCNKNINGRGFFRKTPPGIPALEEAEPAAF
jgi:hypothetical protein